MEKVKKKTRGFRFTNFDMNLTYDREKIGCKYIIVGHEICPKTKTPHHQGYLYFENERSFESVRKKLNIDKAWLLGADASAVSNYKYCTKDGNIYYESGEIPNQGKRSDLVEIKDRLKCEKLRDIALENPETYCRYKSGLRDIRQFHLEKEFGNIYRKIEGTILIGEAGIGKSRYVYDKYGYDNVFVPRIAGDRVWFDKYDGQDVLLLDDYYGEIPWGYFLQLTDGHPCNIEFKGGMTVACWTKVYITSNSEPRKWHKNYSKPEFTRRFPKTIVLENSGAQVLAQKCSGVIEEPEHKNNDNDTPFKWGKIEL